ncbi:MAG: hypothetical protein LBE91_16490 [Tannerella sp.]|nr:hypothetical protein [Tannerella sp.]
MLSEKDWLWKMQTEPDMMSPLKDMGKIPIIVQNMFNANPIVKSNKTGRIFGQMLIIS